MENLPSQNDGKRSPTSSKWNKNRINFFSLLEGEFITYGVTILAGPQVGKRTILAWRFDDYSARSHEENEVRIIDAFENRGLSLTLGVIPMITATDIYDPYTTVSLPLIGRKADLLRYACANAVADIALHGYRHQAVRSSKPFTEFSGVPLPEQERTLAEARKQLKIVVGVPITGFIPPWNTYDENTLSALETLGFTVISAGLSGYSSSKTKLTAIPQTCDLRGLPRSLEAAYHNSLTSLVVVVLHSYDFVEVNKDRGVTTVNDFLDWVDKIKYRMNLEMMSVLSVSQVVRSLEGRWTIRGEPPHSYYLELNDKVGCI